jgi:hypothetical protein
MKKCKHCKSPHRNNGNSQDGVKDICFNCEFIENSLSMFVKSMNQWTPITTGKCNRRLTILDFIIEKIK